MQLRQENLRADSYNLVGFQNHLRFGEQKRILRLIPGPRERGVSALRADSPQHLHQCAGAAERHAATAHASQRLFRRADFGRRRICGIDRHGPGGRDARGGVRGAAKRCGAFPRETAIGSLCHYISHADPRHYQPANIAFDLFPPLDPNPRDRTERQTAVCERALEKLDTNACRGTCHV